MIIALNIIWIFYTAYIAIGILGCIISREVQPIFKWHDLWIGFFWDSKKKWLYIFLIPCLGLIFKFD